MCHGKFGYTSPPQRTFISWEDSTHEAIGQVRRRRVGRWCDCLHRSAGAGRTTGGSPDLAERVVERREELIPGEYIVVLKPAVQDVSGTARALVAPPAGSL